jgi:hypothetical protein
MKKQKVLTKEIVEKLLKSDTTNELDEFTAIDEKAAVALANNAFEALSLVGITTLSPAAAAALGRTVVTKGEWNSIQLHALKLSPDIARRLAKYRGQQLCFGCNAVSVEILKSFRAFKGQLWLGEVMRLDDAAAAELAARSGGAYLDGLEEYTDSPGHVALARAMTKWNSTTWMGLRGLKRIAPAALQALCQYNGPEILASDAILKQLVAARRELAKAKVKRGHLKPPPEWRDGRIALPTAPAAPLKGAGHKRFLAGDVVWFLPKTAARWFTEKLCDEHKTGVSGNYGSGKTVHISAEAAELLHKHAEAWIWLHALDSKEVKSKREKELALEPGEAPPEFVAGRVVMKRPAKTVASAFCSKPDFAGENYRAVLWFRDLLPPEHQGETTDPQGYPAKTMSPEAAALYRKHRDFWLAKYLQPTKEKRTRQAKSTEQLKKSAVKAGLSKQELQAKLDRLGDLVKGGDLDLVAELVSGFEDPWLFEALLAGSGVSEKGLFEPGKPLKKFKGFASSVGLLALAYAGENAELDLTLRRDKVLQLQVNKDNIDICATHLLPRFSHAIPKLDPDLARLKMLSVGAAKLLASGTGDCYLHDLESISPEAAAIIATFQGHGLSLGLESISPEVASRLGNYAGAELSLGVRTLDVPTATALARSKAKQMVLDGICHLPDEAALALSDYKGHLRLPRLASLGEGKGHLAIARTVARGDGDLEFEGMVSLSTTAAAILATHKGLLTLAPEDSLEISDDTVHALAAHGGGRLSLGIIRQVSQKAAAALGRRKGELELPNLRVLDDTEEHAILARKLAELDRLELELTALPPRIADCLRACRGQLSLKVENWTEDSLIIVASHRVLQKAREPKHWSAEQCADLELDGIGELSADAAKALCRGNTRSSLHLLCEGISDGAAAILGEFRGELFIDPTGYCGCIKLSEAAAESLAKRNSFSMFRSMISPKAKKVLEKRGRWTDKTWNRS